MTMIEFVIGAIVGLAGVAVGLVCGYAAYRVGRRAGWYAVHEFDTPLPPEMESVVPGPEDDFASAEEAESRPDVPDMPEVLR